jgi:hypothetical protein
VVEQKMIEQAPVEDEPKPDEKPAAPTAPTTSITGNGPADGFGLGAGNGGGSGGTATKPHGRYDLYAYAVQTTIGEALRKNPETRNASFILNVKVWADLTGRITRASLAGTTGDPKVDDAIQNKILTGLQLQQPPPADMPMPINMRFTARRPN